MMTSFDMMIKHPNNEGGFIISESRPFVICRKRKERAEADAAERRDP